MHLIFSAADFVRNPVLFAEPRTEIDEPAAIAAERPVLPMPATIPPSRRQVGHFTIVAIEAVQPNSSAAGQEKRHVHFDVHGTAVASSQFRKRMVQRC